MRSRSLLVKTLSVDSLTRCEELSRFARCRKDAAGHSPFGPLSSSFVVLSVTLGGAKISAVCGRCRHCAAGFAAAGGNAETRACGIACGAYLVCGVN